jgi:hypothetical protein
VYLCEKTFVSSVVKFFPEAGAAGTIKKKDRFKRWSEAANVFVRAAGRFSHC